VRSSIFPSRHPSVDDSTLDRRGSLSRAAALHTGIDVRLGRANLSLGRIFPATLVEGLIGLLAAVTLYAVATRRSWAWDSALGVHLFGLAGVILGLGIVARGSAPHQAINIETHVAMLVTMAIGLSLLVMPPVRDTLERATPDRLAGHKVD